MATTNTTLLIFLLLCLLQHAKAQPTPRNTDPYAYAKFSPSMAVIIVILIAALFFIAFFSIYIRHCSTRTSSSSTSIRPRVAAARRGLDPQVIETFPTLVYSMVKNLKIGKGALECAVCLCEFEDHETLRLIPKCDHVFHPDCIGEWLTSHKTCPVCRADLAVVDSSAQLSEFAPELQGQQVDLEQQAEQQEQRGTTSFVEELVVEAGRPRGSVHRTKFPRSHSTGHSLIQPGENTDRFTLRLPVEVRKQIMNRRLNRSTSMVLLPREGSSRRGYRTGSSRGKYYRRIEELEQDGKSDRWGFGRVGPFLSKMSSSVRSMSRSLSIRSKSMKSTRGESSSCKTKEPEGNPSDPAQLPV